PFRLYGSSIICHPNTGLELNNNTVLEKAYQEAEIVFLANYQLDKGSYWPRWQYSVITPMLKGEVQPEGYLELNDTGCSYVEGSENGIFLIFWQNENERLTNKNTKIIDINNAKALEEWVLIWAK